MNAERRVIADEVWNKVSPYLSDKATGCGITAAAIAFIAPSYRNHTKPVFQNFKPSPNFSEQRQFHQRE